jgi:hypothetical protein
MNGCFVNFESRDRPHSNSEMGRVGDAELNAALLSSRPNVLVLAEPQSLLENVLSILLVDVLLRRRPDASSPHTISMSNFKRAPVTGGRPARKDPLASLKMAEIVASTKPLLPAGVYIYV